METTSVVGNGFRLTVIAACILRVETGKENHFTDLPTQRIANRHWHDAPFTVQESSRDIRIQTGKVQFTFDKARKKLISAVLQDGRTVRNFKRGNLKGTHRTLDNTNGPVALENGVLSKSGVAVLDDSASLLLGEGGAILPRQTHGRDLYYFAYGHDYRGCLRDFFRLCGQAPLVPRYALGCWWSRYKAYTQAEYTDLMQRFIDEKIPVTVATVDMDWHWVDVRSRFGRQYRSGWTGYSWNTDLFPDYKGFLRWLRNHNFKVTMNLHPADGVRPFESMYGEMAAELGVAPGERIPFDLTDPLFTAAYFKFLHHPYEKDGVDFWWIDWQQGKKTKLKGLDPLWALNHAHYRDNRKENRPLILSRYAGIGSHRFPLGFSGDTTVSWKCLAFQPYFTATASNAGYTWWSHDIGGHHRGRKDDELYLRWVQFGVFSPILRLHSTSNEFMGKEPWNYRYDVCELAKGLLRMRQGLIPYLYSMNYRTHSEGAALMEPMYYPYPGEEKAYRVKNQYCFGSELIVAPITQKADPLTNMAGTTVWLPPGRYTDIFNGFIYDGGRCHTMFRGIESIPVLAREGAIIPTATDNDTNNWRNPVRMTVLVYRGNNTFSLYEDDGEDNGFEASAFAITKFTVEETENELRFSIHRAEGDLTQLPASRVYTIRFMDIARCDDAEVTGNGEKRDFGLQANQMVEITLDGVTPEETIRVTLQGPVARTNEDLRAQLVRRISQFQCGVAYKKRVFTRWIDAPHEKLNCKRAFAGPLAELVNLRREH